MWMFGSRTTVKKVRNSLTWFSHWNRLFGYIPTRMSHLRFFSTVYVLVDNRDLTNLDNPDPSLQHWPAVAAWWSSRARMQGSGGELCDVVFFPVGQASGLHMVHHTWAGTFVLAALCLVFPGLHIVLLDSDCVPVTLFEVEDLWREALRLQHSGFAGPVPTSSWAGGLNSDQVDQMALPDRKPQGVILVTEHNAEVNAGFAVLQGSNHAPPLREEDWQRIPLKGGETHEPVLREYREKLVATYWEVVSTMVSNGRDDRDMTPAECQAWIQTGLALAPFCGHMMDTSLDWAVAWSLIGEWTTRTIFLPLKGEWPRQGHPKNLLPHYEQRSVPMLTWARACFEQGSLPSLLALPGDASLLVLPGDGMFQAQRIVGEKCRPVILHGYEVPKRKCLAVSLLWRSSVGYQWLLPWLACHHRCHYGLDKIGDQYLAPRWTPEFCRHICPARKAYSCSVNGSAFRVMTSISGTPLTVGCLLTKSMLHLVPIVIYHPIQLERNL